MIFKRKNEKRKRLKYTKNYTFIADGTEAT